MRRSETLADVPVIFLTALADRGDVLIGKHAGADDYLVKPIDYDLLLATVRARLNQVERIRTSAVERAERAWSNVITQSRGRTVAALRAASAAFDRFQVGLLAVDRQGSVRLANQEAQRILDEDDGLRFDEGRLASLDPALTNQLRKGIARAHRADEGDEIVTCPRRSGRRPYLVLVPNQADDPESSRAEKADVVVLLLVDTEQRSRVSGDMLVRLYKLTRTETRVALMLIDGKRLDQIAQELEIAQTTVVFHLKNLFRKTGTNRQADLVRVLLSVPLRTGPE
jgi:DNA-binding NarL/FixJ family response regulator